MPNSLSTRQFNFFTGCLLVFLRTGSRLNEKRKSFAPRFSDPGKTSTWPASNAAPRLFPNRDKTFQISDRPDLPNSVASCDRPPPRARRPSSRATPTSSSPRMRASTRTSTSARTRCDPSHYHFQNVNGTACWLILSQMCDKFLRNLDNLND